MGVRHAQFDPCLHPILVRNPGADDASNPSLSLHALTAAAERSVGWGIPTFNRGVLVAKWLACWSVN